MRRNAKVNIMCHDCGCACTEFEGSLCQRILLDAWRANCHKCSKKTFDPKHKANQAIMKGLNSESAEQLWSRTNLLAPFCMHMRRSYFRLYLKRYCVWRNGFTRAGYKSDINPSKSLKRKLDRTPTQWALRMNADLLRLAAPSSTAWHLYLVTA